MCFYVLSYVCLCEVLYNPASADLSPTQETHYHTGVFLGVEAVPNENHSCPLASLGDNRVLLGAVSDAEMDGEVILLREGDQVGLM